jgi:hypothetical protein
MIGFQILCGQSVGAVHPNVNFPASRPANANDAVDNRFAGMGVHGAFSFAELTYRISGRKRLSIQGGLPHAGLRDDFLGGEHLAA